METVDKIVIKKGIQIKFNSKKENFEGKLNNIFFFFFFEQTNRILLHRRKHVFSFFLEL
jgi:hypothetical protein